MKDYLIQIESILKERLPASPPRGALVLSVAESITMTIACCQRAGAEEGLLHALKVLYLEGAARWEEHEVINTLRACFLTKNIQVSSAPPITTDDASRRYFETHLAFNLLKETAESLKTNELRAMFRTLKERLFSGRLMGDVTRIKVHRILSGTVNEGLNLNKYEFEYAELIQKLYRQDYPGLSKKACDNLYYIACNTYLATLATQLDDSIPVNIYEDSVFTMGIEGRGRSNKLNNETVTTTTKGLMKSTSPVPYYGDVANPVDALYQESSKSPFLRSADQASFLLESAWTMYAFSKQVQPYSNGISSTTLAQLRNLLLMKRLGQPHYAAQFERYMTAFAALMVYNSGGHSFFEITEVLKLPYFTSLYDHSPILQRALQTHHVMSTLFYEQQPQAFERAMAATIDYTQLLVYKKQVHLELERDPLAIQDSTLCAMIPLLNGRGNPPLHQALLLFGREQFADYVASYKGNINLPNRNGWTALMLAAQLGRVEQVKSLLSAGADSSLMADGLCALTLAIKSSKLATVKVLLEAGAPVRRDGHAGAPLKRALAPLFYACRQRNLQILSHVLQAAGCDNKDIKKACYVALNVENIEALRALIAASPNKRTLFSKRFVSQLLQKAAASGNVMLIDEMIKLRIVPINESRLKEMIHTAGKSGFIPLMRYLIGDAQHTPIIKAHRQSFLDEALALALSHQRHEMAVFLVIQGANVLNLSVSGQHLESFKRYLKHPQSIDTFLLPTDHEKLHTRLVTLKENLVARKRGLFYGLICQLIAFLNELLPTNYRLTYQDKTEVVADVIDHLSSTSQKRGVMHPQRLFAHPAPIEGANKNEDHKTNANDLSPRATY